MELVIIKKAKENKSRNFELFRCYLAYDESLEEEVILFTGGKETKGFRAGNIFTFDTNELCRRFHIIKCIDQTKLKVTFEF